jgi:hypothetical protein
MFKRAIVSICVGILLSLTGLLAQSVDSLTANLQAIHETVRNLPCASGQLISNRAMNLFLSDKIGSYLVDYRSLSFYKNYVTFSAGDGEFSLNHNLFQPTGIDEPVRTFYVVGVRANVANWLPAGLAEKTGTNQLGATLQKVWVAKPKTQLTDCFEKTLMDTKRASDMALLAEEIRNRKAAFVASLASIGQGSLTDPEFARVKQELYQTFYDQLTDEFSRRFAGQQYEDLVTTYRYKRITTHWTSISAYLPIVLQRFVVVNALNQFAQSGKTYAAALTVNHTRFWESKKAGRFFLSLDAGVSLANSAQTYSMERMSYEQYKRAGGVDTLALGQGSINSIYVGNFRTFLSPVARLGLVYYPPESHIGIRTTIEQHMSTYNPLNWVLGIPVVLIDKKGAPAANFEFQLRYADLMHVIFPNRTASDNLSVNLTVAVPFSKIIY